MALGAARGLTVTVLPMLSDGGDRLSSSRIRRALAAGDLAEAERLLQRPYRFSGQVVSGRGLGKGLGWPTANLRVDGRKFLPMEGVYAARVQLNGQLDGKPPGDGRWLPAVMNLGPSPPWIPRPVLRWRCTCWIRSWSWAGVSCGWSPWPCCAASSASPTWPPSAPRLAAMPRRPAAC